jgi:hypothetical protein
VSLGRVSARFIAGIGAWVLGAGAATGGSLFAVSLLGQSLAPSPTQQLTEAAVNNALHAEAVAAAKAARLKPSPAPSPPKQPPPPIHFKAKRSPTPTPTPSPQASPVVISSAGGTVVATCNGPQPDLTSWSPAQGYQTTDQATGSALAEVTFSNWQTTVAVQVSCVGGVPSAVVFVNNNNGGGGSPGGSGGGNGGPW